MIFSLEKQRLANWRECFRHVDAPSSLSSPWYHPISPLWTPRRFADQAWSIYLAWFSIPADPATPAADFWTSAGDEDLLGRARLTVQSVVRVMLLQSGALRSMAGVAVPAAVGERASTAAAGVIMRTFIQNYLDAIMPGRFG